MRKIDRLYNSKKKDGVYDKFVKNNPRVADRLFSASQMPTEGARRNEDTYVDYADELSRMRTMAIDRFKAENPIPSREVTPAPSPAIKNNRFYQENATRPSVFNGTSEKASPYSVGMDRIEAEITGRPSAERQAAIDKALAPYLQQRSTDQTNYFGTKDISEKPVSMMSEEEKQALKNEYEGYEDKNFFQRRADLKYNDEYERKQALYPNYREVKNEDAYKALIAHGMTEDEIRLLNESPVTEEEAGRLRAQGMTDAQIAALADERNTAQQAARVKFENLVNSADESWGVTAEDLTNMVEDRYANPEIEKEALKTPISSSAFSLATNPVESAFSVGANAYNYVAGKPMRDYNTYTDLTRNTITENIDNQFGKTVYGGAMSIGDMAVAAGLAYATGGGSLVSAGVQALEKASQRMDEGVERNLTPDQIFAEGVASGVTTYLTEKIPMGKLEDIAERGLTEYSKKEIGKTLGAMFLTEGLQEASEDVADWAMDRVVAMDNNQFDADVQNYVAQGMTKEEATLKVIADRGVEMLTDFVIGGIGGGVMGGAASGVAYATGKVQNNPSVYTDKVMNSEFALNELKSAVDSIDTTNLVGEDLERVEHAKEVANKANPTKEDVVDMANVLNEQANAENRLADVINDINYQASVDQNLNEYAENKEITPKEYETEIEKAARNKAESIAVQMEKAEREALRSREKALRDYEIKGIKSKLGEALNNIAQDFENEAAQKNFLENYKGQNASWYAEASLQAFHAGESGQSFNTFLENSREANLLLSENQVTEAYLKTLFYNGQNARTEESTEIKLAKNPNRGLATGGVDELTDLKQKIAEKLGVEVATNFEDAVQRGDFAVALARITVNATADNQYSALMHEMFEFARAYNPKGMAVAEKTIVDMLVNKRGEKAFVSAVNSYKEAYRKAGREAEEGSSLKAEANKTFSEAQEEFVNDAISYIFSTEEGMSTFVDYLMNDKSTTQTEKVSALQAIKDWIDNLIKSIKSFISKAENKNKQLGYEYAELANFNTDELEKLSRLLTGVLDEARENLARKTESGSGKTETKEVAHSVAVSAQNDNRINEAFSINDDGRLIFTNPEVLTDKDWKVFYKEYKKLGYDFDNVEDCKERMTWLSNNSKKYGKTGDILRQDQSDALKKAFGIGEVTESNTRDEALYKENAKKAEKTFGVTNNFKLAGYLDINGKLLDFSEGQGHRVQDHREISQVLDLPDNADYSDGMIEFMNEGNVRLQTYGIDISVEPNSKQKSALRDFFNSLDGEVSVDFSYTDGYTAGSAEYKAGTSSTRILNDIHNYFETGEVPEGNAFRFSIEVNIADELAYFGKMKYNDYVSVQKQIKKKLKDDGFLQKQEDREIYNANSGKTIYLRLNDLNETFGPEEKYKSIKKIYKLLKIATVRSLPEIIRNGVLRPDDANIDNYHDADLENFDYYRTPIKINGIDAIVRFAVKKEFHDRFHIHYVDIDINEITNPDSLDLPLVDTAGHSELSQDLKDTITDSSENSKTQDVGDAHSLAVPSETQDKINASMTMDECRDMLKRAFVSGDIKDYYEGEVKNADEWLEQDGAEVVAITVENDYALYQKFLSKIEGLDDDFTVEDIIEAYQNGTLTGNNSTKKETKRLDVSKEGRKNDQRFYAPKNIEDYKNMYELANTKVTNKNREEVTKARAAILLFAHNKGAAELLGITEKDLNKTLRNWGGYSAKAREVSMRINSGASIENRWTGIENMAWLNRVSVSNKELDNLCGDIKGDSNETQRAYIVRTMCALDTHIDYKGLNFVFSNEGLRDSNVRGEFSNMNNTITVRPNYPNTVAHEMGHYLDYLWGREITGGKLRNALTEIVRTGKDFGREDINTWANNFTNFIESLEDVSSLASSYAMDTKEVFARFVSKFVQWADTIANGENRSFHESLSYNDKFTTAQYLEFARLLQEKSALNLAEQEVVKKKFSLAVHAGDLGKSEGFWQMTSSRRGTGHFGTGTYFVGDEEQINKYGYENRPHEKVDFDNYNLFKPKNYKEGMALHEALKFINNSVYDYDVLKDLDNIEKDLAWLDVYGMNLYHETDMDKAVDGLNKLYDKYGKYLSNYEKNRLGDREDYKDETDFLMNFSDYGEEIREGLEDLQERFDKSVSDLANVLGISEDKARQQMLDVLEECSKIEDAYHEARYADSPSTRFMKAFGYEGIDVRDIKQMDNVEYGSVIYDLKGDDLKRKQEIGTARFSLPVEDTEGRKLSKEQQEYFKDSKVRDKNGNLKVMYHGTERGGFTVFDPEFSDDGISLFFTDDKDIAKAYSGTDKEINLYRTAKDLEELIHDSYTHIVKDGNTYRIVYGFDDDAKTEFEGNFDDLKEYVEEQYGVEEATNYKVYLNAENPLIIDAKGNNWDEIPEVVKGLTTTREYALYAKENGYDSVIINNVVDSGVNADSSSRYKNTQVVIVFDSNQVKSVNNLNPTNNPDIRHSIDVIDPFFDAFQEVEEQVKIDESDLEKFIKNGDLDSDVTKKAVKDVASNIKKQYNSNIKLDRLTADIMSVFKYLKSTGNMSMKDIMFVMKEIARPVLEDVKASDPEQEKMYKTFINKLKGYKISLDAGQTAEVAHSFGSYYEFQRAMSGKMNLSKNGTPLDNIWTELCDISDGHLSYGTNPNDQPLALAEYINGLQPSYQTMEGETLDDAATDLALEIFRQFYVYQSMTDAASKVKGELNKRANEYKNRYKQAYNDALKQVEMERNLNIERLAKELDNLTAEEQEALRTGDALNKAMIEKVKADYQKRLDNLRKQSNHKVAVEKAKFQNAWITKNLKRERTELKNRVLREVKALQNLIAHPSEGATKHVPINLIKPTIEMLEAINLDNGGRNKAIAERLKKMAEVYESFKGEEYSFDYDERIANDIKELREMFENKSYADLEIMELERVIEIVTALKTQIKNANNLILQGKLKDAQEAASSAMSSVRQSRRYDNAAMNALNKYANVHLNAYREFRKLSGYMGGALMDIYEDLDAGSKKEMQIQKDLGAIFQSVLEGKENQKEVKKFISTKKDDLVDIGLTDKNGKPILITRAMRMSLIMHSMNASNMRHVLGSGITIPNMYYFEKGKMDEAYAKGTNYRFVDYAQLLEAIQKNDTNKIEELTKAAEQRIEDMKKDLSPWEQKFLAAAEEMFHEKTGKYINETSLALKGYAIARVKNYFPIKTDAHFTNQEWAGLVQNGSLEGSGVLKERVVSTKPILLEDITNVIERQIRFTSKYAGLAIAVRNFETIMKQTSRSQVDGQLHNLYETIDSVWGASDTKWLKNLMQDIQGGRSEAKSWLMNLRGQFAGATLSLNPSVAIKQAASYPTAAAVVGYKALGKAMADVRKGFFTQKGIKELEEINPLLWYRNQGNATQELADAKAVGFGKKLPQWAQKAINWTQWFDTGTVRTLEYASKYYVDEHFKGLEKGSEEYWNKVSEVFTNVVEQTQPNYSTLHKADIIRNPNSFVKMLVMFKTQPMQNFGIIYDAMGELNAAKISGNKKWINEASSKAALAISSQAISATVFSAMTILSQLLLHRWWKYRDDEGNWNWEKFWLALGEGALSCYTGAFIGGSELYEALKYIFTGSSYYGIEVSVAEMINDFVDSIGNISKNAKSLWDSKTEADRETAAQKLLKYSINLGATVGEFKGTPVNNIKNMFSAMYFYVTDIVNSIDEGKLNFSNDSNIAQWEIETQYERIYQSLDDPERYEKLVNELKDKAKADDPDLTEDEVAEKVAKSVETNVKKLVKKDYLEGNISFDEASDYLEEKGKTEDEAFFQIREWETGESTYGVLKDSISEAAKNPNSQTRKAVIDEINVLLEHGKDKSDISSTLTRNFKQEYIDLYRQNKAANLNAILRTALVTMGYTDEEAKKRISDWLK